MPIALHHQREAKVIGGLDTLVGIWLFLSAFIFAGNQALAWATALTGFVVAVLAGSRALGYTRAWPSWTNLLLGLWTVALPWIVTSVPNPAAQWNCVITGLVIANLALASAMATDTVPAA
jgi:hypothetical protein